MAARVAVSKKKTKQPAPDLRCFNCGEECTRDDYCHGCHETVCSTCNANYSLGHGHEPVEHLEEEIEYE